MDLEPSNRCAVSDRGCKAPQRARWGPLPPAASSQGTLREAGCDKCMKQRCKPVLQMRKWVQRRSNFLNTKANKSPSSVSTDPVHRAEDVRWGRWHGGMVRTPGKGRARQAPALLLSPWSQRSGWNGTNGCHRRADRRQQGQTDQPGQGLLHLERLPREGRQTQGIAQSLPVKCLGWAGL